MNAPHGGADRFFLLSTNAAIGPPVALAMTSLATSSLRIYNEMNFSSRSLDCRSKPAGCSRGAWRARRPRGIEKSPASKILRSNARLCFAALLGQREPSIVFELRKSNFVTRRFHLPYMERSFFSCPVSIKRVPLLPQ